MKRTIDKNRAASGRNLWRLMLGTASLFFLASLSSFGQSAITAADPTGAAFLDYVSNHKEKAIVITYINHPDNASAVDAVKIAMYLDNPSFFGLTAEEAAAMQTAMAAIVDQAEFMAHQADLGASANDAAMAWQRHLAELNGDVSTSGTATVGTAATSTGNSSAAPAAAGNGAPTMTAAP